MHSVQLVDLPWQVEILQDGSSSVFGLNIGHSTFRDVTAKLGEPEAVALFADDRGIHSLEAYYGDVTLGRMEARLVVNLDAPAMELEELAGLSVKKEVQPSGATRLTLPRDVNPRLEAFPVMAITYIPDYGGLDEAFMRARFGKPASVEPREEGRVLLLYPDRGLDILIDDNGKEVFQYRMPDAGAPHPG